MTGECLRKNKNFKETQADCERKAGRPRGKGAARLGDRNELLTPDQFSVDVNVIDDNDTRAGLGSVVDD